MLSRVNRRFSLTDVKYCTICRKTAFRFVIFANVLEFKLLFTSRYGSVSIRGCPVAIGLMDRLTEARPGAHGW